MQAKKFEQLFDGSEAESRRTLLSKETYDDRLTSILEAATVVFAREGYERASMRSVARAAQVSLAGLYHYFDSKERMLFTIQFRSFNSLLNNLREKLHGVDDPITQIQVMIHAHLSYFAANMPALKVCSHELESLSDSAYEELRHIRHEYYELTRSIVDRMLTVQGRSDDIDHHVTTMCLFGMLNWLYRWYDPKRGRSPNVLANQIIEQFLGGVLGGHAKSNGTRPDPDAGAE